jgi:hypothetical protein
MRGKGKPPAVAAEEPRRSGFTWTLTIQKEYGQLLGIEADPKNGLVRAIDPGGLLDLWNRRNPQNALIPGDRLLSANGVSGEAMFGQEGSIGTTATLDLIVERDASAKGGLAAAKVYGMKGKGDSGMGGWAGMGSASGGKGGWQGGWGKPGLQGFGKPTGGKAWVSKSGKDARQPPPPATGNNGVNLQDLLRQRNPTQVPGGPATGEASEGTAQDDEATEEGREASGTEQKEDKKPDPLEALFTPKASPTNTDSMDALFASTTPKSTLGFPESCSAQLTGIVVGCV